MEVYFGCIYFFCVVRDFIFFVYVVVVSVIEGFDGEDIIFFYFGLVVVFYNGYVFVFVNVVWEDSVFVEVVDWFNLVCVVVQFNFVIFYDFLDVFINFVKFGINISLFEIFVGGCFVSFEKRVIMGVES